MNKRILVTGGLGYIGSHTVIALHENNYEVVIVDNLSNSDKSFLKKITDITGKSPDFECFDLTDLIPLKRFFDTHPIDGIIHFAAFKAVRESVKIPLKYYYNNLVSLIQLLQEFQARGLDNFIFSSSCTVYGQADKLPIKEDAPLKPLESPYGSTKQMSEQILRDYANIHIKKVVSLRYFNPIGAHLSIKIGEFPLGIPQNLVPFITQTAIGMHPKLSIFGGDYNTKDGTAIRDYIHVYDLAKAHVAALSRLLRGKNRSSFEVFNLGTGRGHSVLEVVKAFERILNKSFDYQIIDRRSGDIEAAYADTSLAEKELGWKAEISLEEALQTAWAWEKKIASDKEKF
ncbi:UDP-glucose 4-epimerase GalE [Bacteroidetes bacterium endosymbiont of Geopemphigus sp.]|uniref:UDP-glucose 4-epimerase GalE n=1 Tax=Bacteroidetes bacterium endosymbiont of Geopemphigus sp. TaxID=2047937 RepID=UPI000CD2D3DF|nr:UDP-glucose 4-epimerase GalE [Bacteroidetes bacterium endosymbiont of Geopemphigus sp.]